MYMDFIEHTIQFQHIQRRIEFIPGTLLGSYRILRKIGSGGMGAVYEVEHVMLHQRFALKTLFVQGETEAERQDCIDRFLQEARITSQLRHPGIVSVQTLEQDEGTGALYFVMDYVSMTQRRRKDLLHSAFADATAWHTDAQVEAPGERVTLSLEDLYQYGKRIGRQMNPELVRKLMMDVAQALHYAHNLGDGIIHRDIKPANILIQENGHAVLADFGVAKIADSILRKSVLRGNDRSLSLRMEAGGESYHLVLGTVEYMAPELRSGSPPSPQTDLYALGATLYQLLTGELPSGNTLVPSTYGLNPLWNKIVKRCLAVNPDDRYPSLMAFHRALADFPRQIRARKVKCGVLWTLGTAAAVLLLAVPSILLLNKQKMAPPPQKEGIWIPCPMPKTAFQFIEYSNSVMLHSAHPDLCGYVEVPAHVNGKPVTEIAPNAFQSCAHVNGVYLPTGVSTMDDELVPVEKVFDCPDPECFACKLQRSILAQVPPDTRPYALTALSPFAQSAVVRAGEIFPLGATVVRPGESFPLGATVVHENVSYTLDENGWTATSISGDVPEHLVFPDIIGNKIVYKIGDRLCNTQKGLRRVTFPKHLREIGERAFAESGLTGEINFPKELINIRTAAFMGSESITKFVLPPKLERLEHSAFQNTRKMEAIHLPETLTHYGTYALCGVNLQQTYFKLPKCVTKAYPSHFWWHGGQIQTFEIPSISHFPPGTLPLIGTGGKDLTLQMNAPSVTFATNAIRFWHNRHKRLTLQFKEGAQVTLQKNFITDHVRPIIPMAKLHGSQYRIAVRIGDKESVWDGVRFVGDATFIYDNKLMTNAKACPYTVEGETFVRLHDTTCTHFTVPEGITRIKSEAFMGSACESLTLPDSVTHLETASFKGMGKLKTLTLPASINWQASQYDWLFDLCFELERIVITSPFPAWQKGMFSKCRKLKYIVLAGEHAMQPIFTDIPMWDEEKLCKPVHVIHVTQADSKVKNAPPRDMNVLKLQLNVKEYTPVETAITQSVQAIMRTYSGRSGRSNFIPSLTSKLDKIFQVTAPQTPPDPTTRSQGLDLNKKTGSR